MYRVVGKSSVLDTNYKRMDYMYWRDEREAREREREREGERRRKADERRRKEKRWREKGENHNECIVYVLNLLHSLIGTVLCTAHNTTGYSWTSLSFCVINWTNRLNRTSWKPKERERERERGKRNIINDK